ncbi:MAG: SIS domain-containing protein [Verrucomicrobiae bacterium]|nr:SIS domain-containing protein [Verrucomicrobiae bacterium]
MNTAQDYFDKTIGLLDQLLATQMPAIDASAEIFANSIANKGLVFLFGSGHSRMMCEEMAPRQGCFAGFYSWAELALTNHSATVGMNGLRGPLFLEKVEGYGEELLKGFKFGPNDAFMLISTSGVRPLIVEMALGVKARGMPLVALNALDHARNSKPAHQSGKKLMDIADVVIDNCAPAGDCVSELEGLEWRIGPASTVTGAMAMNMLRCATAEKLLERGHTPVMLPSHQFIGTPSAEAAEEQLERYYEAYRTSLQHLYS